VQGCAAASLLALAGVANADTPAAPAPGPFDGATVRRLAQAMAKQPYRAPDTSLPPARSKLTYDQFRGIRFKPEDALWRTDKLPFQVQLLPRGFLYRERIALFEVTNGQAAAIPYSADQFDYADPATRVPDDLGFSGFRVHAPINRADYYDEVCVFQGASYFRAVAKGQVYGLSARGLSIATGDPKGEEFPLFRAFWLERPQSGVNALVLHALLDSPSVTGAYRFTIRPGDTTVFDVESALYPRADITEAGIAPLTGMYYFDANDRHGVDDWRPAAHDSEGLSMWTGHGEELWRPLTDPTDLQISVFTDTNPHGFGLMQRKRAFADYQDLALQYGKRPSLWIEPIGDSGQGAVMLVEIPTGNEVNDNIIAFWRPKDRLAAKGEYDFTYRMHWGWDCPWATKLARVAETRAGRADSGARLFVLDFTGDAVKTLPADTKLHANVGCAPGSVRNVVVEPNPEISGWRISFEMAPGSDRLVEMHCALLNGTAAISETWLYRWTS
jgi:glucans biosynthesis protein